MGLSGALSQTVHSELSAVRNGMAAGAPAMPTDGPCGYLASSLALTKVGLLAWPVISRALIRFTAGCRRPSTRTKVAPVSRSARIADCPTCPAGLNQDRTNINATARSAKMKPRISDAR